MANINGNKRNNKLIETVDADTILGKAGNNRLVGGAGDDLIYGNSGNDQWADEPHTI